MSVLLVVIYHTHVDNGTQLASLATIILIRCSAILEGLEHFVEFDVFTLKFGVSEKLYSESADELFFFFMPPQVYTSKRAELLSPRPLSPEGFFFFLCSLPVDQSFKIKAVWHVDLF